MSALFSALRSRRSLLQAAFTTFGAAGLPQAVAGEAFQVSPWAGPVKAFQQVDTIGKAWRPADFTGCCSTSGPAGANPAAPGCLCSSRRLHGTGKQLVLAINFQEKPASVLQFAERAGITLPALIDVDGQAAGRCAVLVWLGNEAQAHTRGCSPTPAIRLAPKFSTNPSLVRSVNVRTSCFRSSFSARRRTACAFCTSWLTRSWSSRWLGVWEPGRVRP